MGGMLTCWLGACMSMPQYFLSGVKKQTEGYRFYLAKQHDFSQKVLLRNYNHKCHTNNDRFGKKRQGSYYNAVLDSLWYLKCYMRKENNVLHVITLSYKKLFFEVIVKYRFCDSIWVLH